MGWTLAPALAALRDEVNARWPGRDKSSDGTIGDLAHQRGRSEHNPDSRGVVRAIDITARGIDVNALLDAAIGDPRVHYVIYRGRICSRTYGWTWRRSSGHEHHVHISLRNRTSESASWDVVEAAAANTSRWFKGSSAPTGADEEDIVTSKDEVKQWVKEGVAELDWGGEKFGPYLGRIQQNSADAAYYARQSARQTADIRRPTDMNADSDGNVSVRRELADTKTLALSNEERVKRVEEKIDRVLAALEAQRG